MERKRKTIVALVILSIGLSLAAGSVIGRDWLIEFGIWGMAWPLLLLLPTLRAKTSASGLVVLVAAESFVLLAAIALALSLIEPLAGLGVLLFLQFGWVLGVGAIVLVTYLERPRHA